MHKKKHKFIPLVIIAIVLVAIGIVTIAFFMSTNKNTFSNIQNHLPISGERTKVSTKKSLPEIPTNEYWDFASFPNRHIYINNTDKDVVYILDDAGKIVATFWGKDFGLNGFEARLSSVGKNEDGSNKSFLLLTRKTDAGTKFIAIDPIEAIVVWQKNFPGYLDMPQMQMLNNGTWLLENYGETPGVHLTALNPQTGKTIWEITDPNYYGIYFWEKDLSKNQYEVISGGMGWGNWTYYYDLDANTGTWKNTRIRLGLENEPYRELMWYPDENKISLVKINYQEQTNTVLWVIKPKDKLYNMISSGTTANTQIAILPNTILVYQKKASTSMTSVDAFETKDGAWLWQKNYGAGKNELSSVQEFDDVLVGSISYTSSCAAQCVTDVCQGWICFESNPTAECLACQKIESQGIDYQSQQKVGYDRLTGNTLWIHDGKDYFGVDDKGYTIIFDFDPKTGQLK